ncbi:MAG TPA: DNA repair protein RadA [Chthonomonadales bacterium]|nr:DNA repair protein RadA [Chthonomonadales bacterium]
MAKQQTRYVCAECGFEALRWMGRCSRCDAWNTLAEQRVEVRRADGSARAPAIAQGRPVPEPVTSIKPDNGARLPTGLSELDRVLGGGIVAGSVVLVGGDPGIGKSTLLTQVAHAAAAQAKGLYVSGEESAQQIGLRCQRLGALSNSLFGVSETDLQSILAHMAAVDPALTVIDSIQTCSDDTLDSAPGTVAQVRACALALTQAAKASGRPVILIGHVTKEGAVAGPRVLEHMVDAVLMFEGDRHSSHRVLRCTKNRFGSTDEIALLEMRGDGLAQVEDPSASLLSERQHGGTGSCVAALLEGTRPLLVEVQALTSRSYLPAPRRTATGIDYNRVTMLLAVLEKRAGLRLGDQDVFVNVVGGVRVSEPSADLAVALSVASSFREQPVDPTTVLIGEVGLGGEVRAVPHVERRLREAARHGFTRAVVSSRLAPRCAEVDGIEVVGAADVVRAMAAALMPAGAFTEVRA